MTIEVWKNIGAIAGAIISVLTVITFFYVQIFKKVANKLVDNIIDTVEKRVKEKLDPRLEIIEELEKDVALIKEHEEKKISFNRCLIRSIILILRKFEGENLNGEAKEELKNLNEYLINNIQ